MSTANFSYQTYIARQHVRLAGENDGEDLTLWQCLAECQHEMGANSFHHLHCASELIVGQIEHRS